MSLRIIPRRAAGLAVRYSRSALKPSPTFIRNIHLRSLAPRIRSHISQFHTAQPSLEAQPAELSIDDFHDVSDEYLNTLCEKLEDMQDSRTDLDVEYSSGVMNVIVPGAGTYVLNKQPPNKQIWLSSPVTGPKRFDWVVEDGAGDWIYLRDGSSLTTLLKDEIGVSLGED